MPILLTVVLAVGVALAIGLALLLLGLAARTLDPEARERARSRRGGSTIDEIVARDARDHALAERAHLLL